MSNKNDTFNIDDLLNMPNLANEFDKTSELNFSNNSDENIITNEEISIDSLLNNSSNNVENIKAKTKLLEIEESINDEKKLVAPPPPPPIPEKINKVENITYSKNINMDEPSITSAIDLNDFVLHNNKDNEEEEEIIVDYLDEKINEIIDNQTMNDYYKNIEEEQDIKKTSEHTRIYFDDEIEHHLRENDSNNCEQQIATNCEIELIDEINEKPEKNSFFKKIRNKSKEFRENLTNVAQYYKFEYRYSKFTWWVSIFLNLCSVTALSLGSYAIFGLGMSQWLYLPICLFSIVCLCCFIMNTIKIKSMKKELKNNGYQLSKENATATITSIYKKLITSNYYLNWGAAALYVVSGLLILLTFIVCYFINLADRGAPMPEFGDLIINRGTNNSPLIVVWTFAALCFSAMLLQLIYNPLNIYRRNQIEVFYGKTLISEEMIEKYRKSANRKGIAIFIVSTAVISLVVLIVYFVMKKKTKRAVI